MSSRTFDRETLLDLSVNVIPMGIILFFIVVFVAVNPFGSDPVATALQLTIAGVMFVAIGVLTYVSGKAIAESERELESMGVVAREEAPAEEAADAPSPVEADD